MNPLIVFVPGFAGSNLYAVGSRGEVIQKMWLSQLDVALNGINKLDARNEFYAIDYSRVRALGVLDAVYSPFLRFLPSVGIDFLTFPYDWRADINTNAAALGAYLDLISVASDNITVVGHSMGGLVAAWCLVNAGPIQRRVVKRLVTCGTPWQGSFKSLQLLHGTHDVETTIARFQQVRRLALRRALELRYAFIAAHWPGVYDLLPSPQLLATFGVDLTENHWLEDYWPQVNEEVKQPALTAALARRFDTRTLPDGMVHHNWRGVNRPTPGPMPRPNVDGYYFGNLVMTSGDSVVPEASAFAPRSFNSIQKDFNVDHEQFLSSDEVLASLAVLVRG